MRCFLLKVLIFGWTSTFEIGFGFRVAMMKFNKYVPNALAFTGHDTTWRRRSSCLWRRATSCSAPSHCHSWPQNFLQGKGVTNHCPNWFNETNNSHLIREFHIVTGIGWMSKNDELRVMIGSGVNIGFLICQKESISRQLNIFFWL